MQFECGFLAESDSHVIQRRPKQIEFQDLSINREGNSKAMAEQPPKPRKRWTLLRPDEPAVQALQQ
jgi:hypothetical protein